MVLKEVMVARLMWLVKLDNKIKKKKFGNHQSKGFKTNYLIKKNLLNVTFNEKI